MSTSNIVLSAPAKGNGFAKYSFSTLFKPTDNIAGEVCYLKLFFVGIQRDSGSSDLVLSQGSRYLDPLSTYAISISFNQPVSYSSINSPTGSTTVNPSSSNFLNFANQNSRIIGLISTAGSVINEIQKTDTAASLLTGWASDLSNVSWTASGVTAVVTSNASFDGVHSASLVTATSNDGSITSATTCGGHNYYTMSARIKRISGTGSIKFGYGSALNGFTYSVDLSSEINSSDSTLVTYDFLTQGSNNGAAYNAYIVLGTAGDSFMIEQVWITAARTGANDPLGTYFSNDYGTSYPSCLVNIPMTQEEVTVSISKLNSSANLPSYNDNLEQFTVGFTLEPSNRQSTIPR